MTSMRWLFFTFALIFMVFLEFLLRIYLLIPDRKQLMSCFTTKMYSVYLCPGSKDYVPLNQISKIMQKTLLLTEDSLFYEHQGFDWSSIEKSAKENLAGGKYKRGGSTITQQLAKNLYLSKDKTIARKVTEAFITFQIEKHLTKREILEKYFNVVEFGKDLYGIKPAAWHYFKKSPSQLDTIESAFLAMLLPNPKKYSGSFYNKKLTPFAFKRMRQIVADMYRYNRISEDQYIAATAKLKTFFSTPAQIEEIDRMDSESTDDEMFDGGEGSPDDAADDNANSEEIDKSPIESIDGESDQ